MDNDESTWYGRHSSTYQYYHVYDVTILLDVVKLMSKGTSEGNIGNL